MRHVMVRISWVVLVLIALILIALVLALVWFDPVFAQPIAVYPQSLELVIASGQLESRQPMYTAGSIKSEYRAWLEIENKDGLTSIDLVCENLTDREATLNYSFSIERVGPGGRSSSQQSGIVRIKAGKKGIISHAEVSASGSCKINMTVYKDGNLVAEEERIYPGQEV